MKNRIFLLPLLLLVVACGNNKELAQEMYNQAELLYNQGDYVAATQWVDSISATYPQEVDVIRQGMMLQCHINQKRYERELIEVDSLYNATTAELALLKGRFELVREGKEQTLANYVYKGTRTKGEVKRSELRVQVTEKGDLQLTSVYYGTSKLNHTGISAQLADGTFAQTATIAYDGGKNYRYQTGDNNVEMVTYNLSQCRDVVALIAANPQEKCRVKYTGGKSKDLNIDKLTREAIANSYRMAQLFVLADSLQSRREFGIIQLELADRQLMKLQDKAAAEK
jgi:hypothetical protein